MDKPLQTAIAAILVAALSYYFFADSFVGTFQDLVLVFFWGFTTDVSIDTMLSLTRDFKRPSANSAA